MPSPGRKDRIRQSWQPHQLSGAPARVWLILRRLAATLIALGLIGYCIWLLIGLLWVPHTYFAYWTASTYQPLVGQPLAFVAGDYNAIKQLEPAFAESELPDPFKQPLTKELLEKHLKKVSGWELSSKDTLIVYLTAHGVVRGNQARLRCEDASDVTVSASAVLDALKPVPAKTKLLILDAGRDQLYPSTGAMLNTFPKLLERAVQEANDTNLWVLSANAPLERSHIAASRRQSVFGHVLSRGLGGRADIDGDDTIKLDELYNYVQSGVLDWLKKTTEGRETQTPLLFHCDLEKLEAEQLRACFVLSTRRLATDLAEDEEAEQEGEPGGLASSVNELAVGQAEEFAPEVLAPADDTGEGENGDEDSGSAKGGGAAESSTATTNYAARAQQRRAAAWQFADTVLAPPAGSDPGIVMPPIWRPSIERLLWYDHFCTAGIPANQKTRWTPAIQDLDLIHENLKALASSDATKSRDGITIDEVPDESISLAMAMRLAGRHSDQAVAKEIAAFIDAYDQWLAREKETSLKTLDVLVNEKDTADEDLVPIERQKHYYEFQLLHHLRYADVSDELVRSVLSIRRMAEKIASDPLCGEGWAQDAILQADLLRWQGERLILDQTHNSWIEESAAKLADAKLRYERAARDLKLVSAAIDQRNQLLIRAPEYVRWAHLSGGGDREYADSVKKLFARLSATSNALARPMSDSIVELESLVPQLQEAREELEKRVASSRDPGQIASLLDTSLPSAKLREELHGAWAEEERQRLSSDTATDSGADATSMPELTDQQRSQVRNQIELELELARLAGCDKGAIAKLAQPLKDPKIDLLEFENIANEIADLYADALKLLNSRIASIGDLEAAERQSQLAHLRNDVCHWILVGGRYDDKLESTNRLVASLNKAAWHDLLLWQAARFQQAANDAPTVEVAYLRNAAENYAHLASTFSESDPDAATEPPLQFVDTTSRISLATTDSVSVPFKLRATRDAPLRLVAQFNAGLVQISGDLPSKTADFPVDANSPAMKATATLAAGNVNSATIQVKRLPNARGATKLILKAISGDTIVRHEIDVELPGRELLDVTVNAGREFWSRTNEGIILYPLPNRLQDFSFNVVNRTNVAKKLEASLFIPSESPASDKGDVVDTGAQTKETADKILEAFGRLVPLGPTIPVNFESGQTSVRLVVDPKGDAEANLLLKAGDDPKKFPGPLLQHGLLLVLADVQSGDTTIRRIQIRPQRPRRYLKAEAQYDQNSRRLQVDVSAINQNVVPQKGLPVALAVDAASVSTERDRDDQGMLTAPDYSKSMYVHLSNNAPPEVYAFVHADGFPRAFVFRISPYASAQNIAPIDDAMDVRIISPRPGTAYRAPAARARVELQIDAPEGSFSGDDSQCYAEVGLDGDRDGEFRNESPLSLRSDRQVAIHAKSLSPDGTLKLNTLVSDFQLQVPLPGSHKIADLRARLVTPLGEKSSTVEVILDGQGPSIHAQLRPGRQIESGAELEVRVFTDPPDLSGVSTVEAVFETSVSAGAEPKWEAAKPSDMATWTAMLKTEGLPLGQHNVLIRAVDRVGNKREGKPESITIVRSRAAAESTPGSVDTDVSNSVSGQVVYVRQGVPADVTLESAAGAPVARAAAGADGRFKFSKVPPGTYVLKAKSTVLYGGYSRQGKVDVTVNPRPAPATSIPPLNLQ